MILEKPGKARKADDYSIIDREWAEIKESLKRQMNKNT